MKWEAVVEESNVGREDGCCDGLQKGCNEGKEDCWRSAMVIWKVPKKAGWMIELMVLRAPMLA